ncbi:hypothetical protein [Actinomadura fibrosa]|uniref:Uncharacterized protein n=1 Tax=Actinomadura fibrosa TaxID=111802 RepID=A0ABW2XML6_9ACTN
MTEQPGDVLDEAAKLFDALRSRIGGAFGTGGGGGHGTGPGGPEGSGSSGGDVWSRATTEEPEPRIATGAPECRDCPVCRAIAIKREAGGDVGRHVREAGQSLFAAALDVVAAFDRTRPEPARPDRSRPDRTRPAPTGTAGTTGKGAADAGDADAAGTGREAEASAAREAGTSERSARPPRDGRPDAGPQAPPEPGDAWSAATGGGPTDRG